MAARSSETMGSLIGMPTATALSPVHPFFPVLLLLSLLFSLPSLSCLSSIPFSLFPSVNFYPIVFFGTFCPLPSLWAWP